MHNQNSIAKHKHACKQHLNTKSPEFSTPIIPSRAFSTHKIKFEPLKQAMFVVKCLHFCNVCNVCTVWSSVVNVFKFCTLFYISFHFSILLCWKLLCIVRFRSARHFIVTRAKPFLASLIFNFEFQFISAHDSQQLGFACSSNAQALRRFSECLHKTANWTTIIWSYTCMHS